MEVEKKKIMRFNILVIVCIVIFCITLSPKQLQNDTYYTIKIGEHIVDTKTIDMKDSFSWHEDLTYTYPHWMYDTGIYMVYHLGENVATSFGMDNEMGGMTAIYISTILLASILGILIYRTNVKIIGNHVVSFFLTLGVIYFLRDFIAARAQLISYIFFTLEILFIEKFLETKKKRYAVGLFVLAGLIANCHAAVWYLFFILALPYIAEACVIKFMESNLSYVIRQKIVRLQIARLEKRLEKLKDENKKNKISGKLEVLNNKISKLDEDIIRSTASVKRLQENSYKIKTVKRDNIKWLILVLIICIFSGLFTPQTSYEPYTHMIKLLSGNTTGSISEHIPTVIIESVDALIIVIMLLALLIFTDTKVSYKDLFMIAGLVILMLMSRRQISILALIGVYSLNRIITDFIKKYDKEDIENKVISVLVKPYGATVIILLAILCGTTFYGSKWNQEYISKRLYPVDASKYILENLNVKDIKIYNAYNYGSYLLYKNIPVFIDSRCDLYSPEFNDKDIFSDALNIAGLEVDYEDKFEEYGVTHIVIEKDSKLKMLLEKDDNYNKIYNDDFFYVFERIIGE